MKTYFKIICCLILCLLTGCEEEGLGLDENVNATTPVQLALQVDIPLMDLPKSRSFTTFSSVNDKVINDYVLWIFDDDKFVEAIHPDDTYPDENGQKQKKVIYDGSNGGQMLLTLKKAYTSMRIMMVANYPLINSPLTQTTWESAEKLLEFYLFHIDNDIETSDNPKNVHITNKVPMYGTSGPTPINVTIALDGTIQLRRAMAKIVIDTSDAADHFTLEEAYIYHIGTTGHLFPVSQDKFSPIDLKKRATCDIRNHRAFVYLPEIKDITADKDKKNGTVIIFGGKIYDKAKGQIVKEYFRLEFIKRERNQEDQTFTYEYVKDLERNHCYFFDIDYLLPEAGRKSIDEALRADAANKIGDETNLIVCKDANIMDITTDNYTFLGVTSSFIETTLNGDGTYYTAHLSIATNHEDGWRMEDLPEGVFADMTSWKPEQGNENVWTTQSVWFFLDKKIYDAKNNVIVYIYSGNIRKRIEIILHSHKLP